LQYVKIIIRMTDVAALRLRQSGRSERVCGMDSELGKAAAGQASLEARYAGDAWVVASASTFGGSNLRLDLQIEGQGKRSVKAVIM
jgi:hypothetical protein